MNCSGLISQRGATWLFLWSGAILGLAGCGGGGGGIQILGKSSAECCETHTYVARRPTGLVPFNATWTLENNTAGAVILGPATFTNVTTCSIDVVAPQNGSFEIRVVAEVAGEIEESTKLVTAADTMPPAIICPVSITVGCATDPIPANTGGYAIALDNCNAASTITFSDVTAGGECSGNPVTIVRTWTADDGHNTSTCEQIITRQGAGGAGAGAFIMNLGGGCGAPLPIITSTPISPPTSALRITNAPPKAPISLAVEGPVFPPPVALDGGCVLWIAPGYSTIFTSFATDANGEWQNDYFVDPAVSITVRFQAALLAPGSSYLTNGLAAKTGPALFRTVPREIYPDTGLVDFAYLPSFPSGLTIGILHLGSGSGPPNGFHWDGNEAGKNALKTFLSLPDGPSGPIGGDEFNPVTTFGGGSLALETAALALTLGLDPMFLGTGFGDRVYYGDPGAGDSLSGLSVFEILDLANNALAGLGIPAGYSFGDLFTLIRNLNLSYAGTIGKFGYGGYMQSFWAGGHLFQLIEE